MAALMKKRVLAEINQSQSLSLEPPVKRLKTLRLSLSGSKNNSSGKSSSTLAYIECLATCKGGNDALQLLVRISDNITQMAVEDIPTAVKKLSERFIIEKEASVRAKIFWVFAELGELTYDPVEKTRIVNETANLLKKEESHRVKSQGLATLLKLGEYNKLLALKIARELLPDTWHGVQTRCLSIIGRYLCSNAADDFLEIVNNYTKSQEPRVRAQAFETMAELHSHRGCRLPPSFFREACQCLRDDYEIVRRAVLKLIWLLGNEYPAVIISKDEESKEDMRMIDSAFCKLCSLMGDLSPRVRASAMSLLGSMRGASPRHIEQALDKKQICVEDQQRLSGEAERTSINTCGAFIHGLEDEFLEVRTAAVESLCALSLESPRIAHVALEFMVDMFNDEIQDVRLRAIESLRKMSVSVTLGEEQLEVIVGALEDFSGEVREGLHSTLAASRMATNNCLNMCVTRLLDNLNRYPQDKDSIYNCLAAMGASHPYLTLPLVPQLLSQHTFFDTPEPNVVLPSYVSVLVLIFNAAAHCPTMHSLFNHHTVKHYHYLRDTMPHLVPRLKPALQSSGVGDEKKLRDEELEDENARKFLDKMVRTIEEARPGGKVYAQLLEAAARDLDGLAEMDQRLEGVARFTSLYIRCLLLLRSVVKELTVTFGGGGVASASSAQVKTHIGLLQTYSQKLLRLFIGLGENDTALATDIWLKALALDLVRATVDDQMASALNLSRQFLVETDLLPQDDTKLPPFSKALVKHLAAVGEAKPALLAKILLPLLVNPPLKGEDRLPRPPQSTRYCKATIEDPVSDSDAVLKFTGGLILGIPMTAKIVNLRDLGALRIKLRHPDQNVQLLLPRKSDLKPQHSDRPHDYRLRTNVLISHQVWMEACSIDVSLALLVSPGSTCAHPPHDDPCVIDLCKPTKVSVSPKQVKRGI